MVLPNTVLSHTRTGTEQQRKESHLINILNGTTRSSLLEVLPRIPQRTPQYVTLVTEENLNYHAER